MHLAKEQTIEEFANANNPAITGVFLGPRSQGFTFASDRETPSSTSITTPALSDTLRADIRTRLEEARITGENIQKQIDQLSANQITTDTGIVDTDAVVQEEIEVSDGITTAAGPDFTAREETSDRILDLLEKQARQLETDAKAEFADIERRFQEAKTGTEKAQKRETGTFQVGLARIGGFLGESASAAGAMVNLAGEHRAEINMLRGKRDSAINAARRAQQSGQFKIAQLKLEEIKSLENDIDKRRQDFFDNILALQKEERARSEQEDKINNQLRDDARSAINSIITNFGGIPLDALDDATFAQISELSSLAGIPLSSLNQPTLREITQEATERQRDITNLISAASLNLREREFSFRVSQADDEGDFNLEGFDTEAVNIINIISQNNGTREQAIDALKEADFDEAENLSGLVDIVFSADRGDFSSSQLQKLEEAGKLFVSRQEKLTFLIEEESAGFDAEVAAAISRLVEGAN